MRRRTTSGITFVYAESTMLQATAARRFARHAHRGQTYGPTEPYVVHLDAVAHLARPYGEVAQAVAYLHDVIEDTATPLDAIERRFGKHVAACVALCTDEPGPSRAERKRATNEKLARVQPRHHTALVVKVADRLANVEACLFYGDAGKLGTYRAEHAAFRAAAHRPGLCDPLWAALDAALAA